VGNQVESWDNTENLRPELREFPIFESAFNSDITKDLDYWGLVSPKFEKKSNLSCQKFIDWVVETQKTITADVYFINPVPIVESLFPGVIQHGETCHPGLLGILQRNIATASQIDLATLYMDCNTFAMCNYFIANRKFWDKYILFVHDFLLSVEAHPNDYDLMYAKSANYGPNKALPYYTFAVERLFSIFINLYKNEIKFAHYPYSRQDLLVKTSLAEPIIDELRCLSDIKQIAVSAGYPNMMQHWAFLRNRLAQQNQYLFLME
jgi:hypothetical protein